MTYQEFLKALEKTPRDWQLYPSFGHTVIRRQSPYGQCPISSLQNIGCLGWRRVADSLGIDSNMASIIMECADGWRSCVDYSVVRADLLRACGLSEQS